MRDLHWGAWLLFIIITLVALAISWWSMYTLATDSFHMPVILAGSVSLAFDLGAAFLAIVAIYYARAAESGFSVEVFALVFMFASAWINGMHADILNYGIVGIVLFAAAPVMSAIFLKVILNYLNRQALKSHGRTVRHLPVAGKLTWILKPKQSFALLMLAMNDRLQSAWINHVRHDEISVRDIEKAFEIQNAKARFAATPVHKAEITEIATETDPEIEIAAEIDAIAEDLKNDIITIPIYLNDKMSTREIARRCWANGMTDPSEVFKYVNALNDNEVSLQTVRKAVSAAKMSALKGDL